MTVIQLSFKIFNIFGTFKIRETTSFRHFISCGLGHKNRAH